MKCLEARIRTSVRVLTLGIALVSSAAHPQVEFQTRTIRPSAATTAEFVASLRDSKSAAQHGLISLPRHPTSADRELLQKSGVQVLEPFQGTTYYARVEQRLDVAGMRSVGPTAQLVPLKPEDRTDPQIWRGDYGKFTTTPPGEKPRNFVSNADGTLNLGVIFQRETPEGIARQVLERNARSFEKRSDEFWVAVVPRDGLRRLAAEDTVKWIEAAPPPPLPENDNTRAEINVDALQNFDTATGQVRGLGGNGVQVAVFDNGIDQTHNDLTPALLNNDATVASHGTHVAGIILGRGTLSNGNDSWGVNNGGTPFQFRGMAPQAQLIEVGSGTGDNVAVHQGFITAQGMDLSNHSYSFSFDGDYSASNQTRDRLVRGDATAGGVAVPGRLHIYSAGNHGTFPNNGGNQVGYFALTKQVKNGLLIGNWDAATNRIATSSSLGPAQDGRIKPDVVAPGSSVRSTGFCPAGENNAVCQNAAGAFVMRQDFYRPMSGTSMAAPAATGALALSLQQFATTMGVNLDRLGAQPATWRAVMIHAATDVQAGALWFNNPDGAVQPGAGPDFVTGWGLIDARGSANLIANRQLREGTINNTCDTRTLRFRVPAGATNVRATLAWDDVAGNPALPDTSPKLVNDLDLVLIDPAGHTHFPWQLDQAILDSTGAPLPNDRQPCNTAISVRRAFNPVANPVFVAPGSPMNVNDVIPAGGVPAAVRGRDHLNNVEVVDAPGVAGVWQAHIVGFSIPQGPQPFSMVGQSFGANAGLFLHRPGRGAAWVVGSNDDNTFSALYSVGDNGAALPNGLAGYDMLSAADKVVVFDYNNDGRDDLFFYRPGRGAAWVARSDGAGVFTAVQAVGDNGAAPPNGLVGYDMLSPADQAIRLDYNNDKRDDLFFYRVGRGAAWLARSNGDGTFTAVLSVGDNGPAAPNGVAGYDLLSAADQLLRFDFNGDGNDDLFFFRPGRGAAWVARSNGDGTFTAVHSVGDNGAPLPNGIAGYDMLSPADRALAFDYDGDGDDDLFFFRPGRGAAWVARSNGDGTFTAVHAVGDNGAPLPNGIAGYDLLSPNDQVLVFDHNGDGLDDLFLYRPGRGAAWVAHSNGDGTFTAVHAVGDNGNAAPNGIAGYDLLSAQDRAYAVR